MMNDKCKFRNKILFLMKYAVITHRNCLIEAIPMCTYNMLFHLMRIFYHIFKQILTILIISVKYVCRNEQVFM